MSRVQCSGRHRFLGRHVRCARGFSKAPRRRLRGNMSQGQEWKFHMLLLVSLPMYARFCGRARDATVLDGAKTAYVRVVTYSLHVPRGACPHAQPSVRPSAALGDRCAVAGAVAREDARRRAGAQRTGGKHMLLLLRWRFHVAEARGRSKVAVAGVVVDDTEAPSPGRFGVSGSRRRDQAWRGRACRTRRSGARAKCTCTLAPWVVSVRTRHTGAWRAPHTSRAESKKNLLIYVLKKISTYMYVNNRLKHLIF
jgi:hypothetical protein